MNAWPKILDKILELKQIKKGLTKDWKNEVRREEAQHHRMLPGSSLYYIFTNLQKTVVYLASIMRWILPKIHLCAPGQGHHEGRNVCAYTHKPRFVAIVRNYGHIFKDPSCYQRRLSYIWWQLSIVRGVRRLHGASVWADASL